MGPDETRLAGKLLCSRMKLWNVKSTGKLRKWGLAENKSVTNHRVGDGMGGIQVRGLEWTEVKQTGMQELQGSNAATDTHLQRFQCVWLCVASLERPEIIYKGPEISTIVLPSQELNLFYCRLPSCFTCPVPFQFSSASTAIMWGANANWYMMSAHVWAEVKHV